MTQPAEDRASVAGDEPGRHDGRGRVGEVETRVLRDRHQEQVEHAHREAHEGVLDRVQQRRAENLPQEEHQEGQDDEQHGVFHCAFSLLVDVHWLHQAHAEGRGGRLLRELIAIHARGRPPGSVGAAEILDLPLRGEPGGSHLPGFRERRAGEAWMWPGRPEADDGLVGNGQDVKTPSPVQFE